MTQYRSFHKKRSYFWPTFFLLLALLLSFSAFRGLFGIRSLLVSAAYPFQYVSSAAWKTAINLPASLAGLARLSSDNRELKEKLEAIQARLSLYDELATENKQLREALAFRGNNRYGFNLLAARVVGHGAAPDFSVIEIDRGGNAGVTVDTPVLVKEGLVGRVIEVSRFSSKVLLITDSLSSVAGVDQRTRDYGVVSGYSPNLLSMKYVSGGEDVEKGDGVVTASISGIFPAGIPIGTVSNLSKGEADFFYKIELKPSVDFSALERVFLIL